jgi:A/G-specific adenine glycosylase
MIAVPPHFFVHWYQQRGRDFPWRSERVTPYQVLFTEMLLRQTKAENVAKVWDEFFCIYPDVSALATAHPNGIKQLVNGLGFANQRTEALQQAATHLLANHGGEVPDRLEALEQVPHVGKYTARATLTFAFGQKWEIVDTGVLRFLARLLGKELTNLDIRKNSWAFQVARNLLPEDETLARPHNFGLLDFIATKCKPRKPLCVTCNLRKSCAFGSNA